MTPRLQHAVVIGAGVAGLAAAWSLARRGVRVTVLERGTRVGGLVETEQPMPGVSIEHGPDGLLAGKPGGLPVLRALGLEEAVVRGGRAPRRAFVATDGRLVPLPAGLFAFRRRALPAMLTTPLLSPAAKARLLLEPLRRVGRAQETVAAFFDRRFGPEVRERLVGPMLRGLYGAPPDALAMRAVFPSLADYEDRYRSVALALLIAPRVTTEADGLLTLAGGMETIPRAMAATLEGAIRLGVEAHAVEPAAGGVRVRLADGGAVPADAVVVATSMRAAARILASLDADAAAVLGSAASSDADVVTLAFDRCDVDHPLDGTGFVTGSPALATLACTFASEKWHGRAPEGLVLLRSVLSCPDVPDEELVRLALEELGPLLGLRAAPHWTRTRRHRAALPVHGPGQLERLRAAAAGVASRGPIALAGNYLDGVGVPDAIASGLGAAAHLAGDESGTLVPEQP